MKTKSLLVLLSAALAFGLTAGMNLGMTSEEGERARVTGCLRSGTEPNTYILTNDSGSYEIVPTGRVNLRRQVGNEVEVTGTLMETEATSGLRSPVDPEKGSLSRPDKSLQNPFASEESSRAGTRSVIRASSIRHISDMCR